MPIERIHAQLNSADPGRSTAWFATLFDRVHDAAPMDGLREWHHGGQAALQLFRNADAAGHGTMTLILSRLTAERARLMSAGWEVGTIEPADAVSLLQLRDPDGNLVVLAEPGQGG